MTFRGVKGSTLNSFLITFFNIYLTKGRTGDAKASSTPTSTNQENQSKLRP